MNKTCFVLIILIAAINPASLFAGETMTTRTTPPPSGCNFRVDKCATSVATDPSYMHFKDGASIPGPTDVGPAQGDPSSYRASALTFRDYAAAPQPTVDDLLALIRKKLSNCPEVELTFDDTTGDITLRYLHSSCGCEWTVNIRDVKAGDFVWQRTTDNYSEELGQMERRKFHCDSKDDAEYIQSAFSRICVINGWIKN
ncbi:MAG: hypothetical protein LV480_09855 [Methylacidiphilales bacterium]|nr:hypothetical protein [Candidatus Methylacidiphilales bacterium]